MSFKSEEEREAGGFVRRIDLALGLIEGASEDPTATSRPTFGASRGPSKGSKGPKYTTTQKKKKKKQIEDDISANC